MLTLITPTQNRPVEFSRTEQFIKNQSYIKAGKPFRWIVCCDGDVSKYTFTMNQEVIHRTEEKVRAVDAHSIAHNYYACAELLDLTSYKILCIEDDEWYHPDYFAMYDKWLDKYDLVGLSCVRLYNTKYNSYAVSNNQQTTAMAATGFTMNASRNFKGCCCMGGPWIDITMWTSYEGKKWLADIAYNGLYVGLKNGEGIGQGHNICEPVDEDGSVLKLWLGEDAKYITRAVPEPPKVEVRQKLFTLSPEKIELALNEMKAKKEAEKAFALKMMNGNND